MTFSPVAKATARPWVVWRVSHFRYGLGIYDEQRMPVTEMNSLWSISS